MLRFLMLSCALFAVVLLGAPMPSVADDDKKNPNPPNNAPVGQPIADTEKVDPPAGPGGMVYVPGGDAKIGTNARTVFEMTKGRSAETVQVFYYETPDHDVRVDGYFIDKHEVTNGQYYAFLQATAGTVYNTATGALGTLDDVAANLLRLKPKELKNKQLKYWLQLYRANKDAIWEAFGEDRVAKLKVMRPGNQGIDELKTAEKFRFEPLPRKLELKFYTRRPPFNWPGIEPPQDKWNHPVRDVSYLDAQRFAEWAGKHIPTEVEYEYAARGPYGWTFPWGSEFPEDTEKQKARGNWGAQYIDERYEPTTVSVDEIPGSISWCGAMNMIGNVAEWTSSWFYTYPGFERKTKWDTWLGKVKVIRGGHGVAREMLTLRSAGRNFMGSFPKAPPYVSNRFDWVGFRCAWYPRAGQNQLEPIIERSSRGGRLDRSMIADERYRGAVTENFAESGAFDENHVYVLGQSHAIVMMPVRQVLWENGKETWISEAWKKASRFRKTKDFAKRSTESDYPVLIVGVLHTDVGLDKVYVRKPVDPKKKDKENKSRGRGRRRAPETIPGKVDAGTYLLTVWHGRLALASSSLEFECFISPEKVKKGAQLPIEIVNIDPEECPEPTFKLDALADECKYAFHVPLGGKKTDPDVLVKITGTLTFELGSLDAKGAWRQGLPFDLPDWEVTKLPNLDSIAEAEAAYQAKLKADAEAAANGGGAPPAEGEGDEDDDEDEDGDDDAGDEPPAEPKDPGKDPGKADEPGK